MAAGTPVQGDGPAIGDLDLEVEADRVRLGLRLARRDLDRLGGARGNDLVAGLGLADAEDAIPDGLAGGRVRVADLRLAVLADDRGQAVAVALRPRHGGVRRPNDLVEVPIAGAVAPVHDRLAIAEGHRQGEGPDLDGLRRGIRLGRRDPDVGDARDANDDALAAALDERVDAVEDGLAGRQVAVGDARKVRVLRGGNELVAAAERPRGLAVQRAD